MLTWCRYCHKEGHTKPDCHESKQALFVILVTEMDINHLNVHVEIVNDEQCKE
jgi:hypothetical protein